MKGRTVRAGSLVLGLMVVGLLLLPWAASAQRPVTLVWWSHWADQENRKDVLLTVAKLFEQRHPGVRVEITWWDKARMWPAMRAAFTAGTGFPDVFYYDTNVLEFIAAGWLADLTTGIRWENVEGWAKQTWILPGPEGKPGVWALPLEASTDELYYNKKLFRQLGIPVPSTFTFNQDQLKHVVAKCVAAGYAAFSEGIGDRDYPGQYVTNFLLLSKLGEQDLRKLWTGELSFKDPRVVEVFRYMKELVDLKAYPRTFTTMTLSESHRYFHTEQKACMFPVGSWYTARAFAPPERGGQPADFELGMLRYPAMRDGKGVGAKILVVSGSLAAAAKSPNLSLAKELVGTFADIQIGNLWMAGTATQTGIKTDPARIRSEWTWYFEEYSKVNRGVRYAVLEWRPLMKPAFRQVYAQVVNQAFPAGVLTADESLNLLEQARLTGK